MKEVGFELTIIGDEGWDLIDDNLDVVVQLSDGRRYTATFFTLENIRSILASYKKSGECFNGLYFWAAEMIIVERLDRNTIEDTIVGLIREGEFESAFSRRD